MPGQNENWKTVLQEYINKSKNNTGSTYIYSPNKNLIDIENITEGVKTIKYNKKKYP